jgi:hypothetical protein
MSEVSEKIEASFKTGFVDKKFHSGGFFESKLIMNDIDRSPLLSNVILLLAIRLHSKLHSSQVEVWLCSSPNFEISDSRV